MSDFNRLGVARSRLCGSVSLGGAKNSALRLLAASLLTAETVTLANYPSGLLDAQVHVDMLVALGKAVELKSADEIRISERGPMQNHLRGCEKIAGKEKGNLWRGRLTITDTEIIACRSFLWV